MAQAIDPVCGMTVDTDTVEYTSTYKGQTQYFCAAGCKKAFDQEPEHYLSGQTATGGHQHSGHHH
ncbi:MAG: YHS domain-containing protein [Chloroflexi bacterium]|nr:YHS domain-containing protein [Chloroflexota bacterium]